MQGKMCNVHLTIYLIAIVSFSIAKAENNRTFPKGFLFGVSTSAYQTEGAWNVDGKGENIWDRWIHSDPSRIKNNDNADVACNSYDRNTMFIDVTLAAILNVTHYRFSISWSRLLPTGFSTETSMKAIIHYQQLIDNILNNNMIPVATLYYYDLPQPLQDLGGWTNPDMVNYFADYARVAFQHFSKVQYWITFNDPRTICRLGYGEGVYAPGLSHDGVDDYLCSYVVLKSHAEAYHIYKEEFPDLKAKVSISLDIEWSEPASNSSADLEAAERRNLFEFGIYGHPLYIGNWPQVVIDRVRSRSTNENLDKSRLPEFTQEEIDYIKGTTDFMAINTYTTHLVSDTNEAEYGEPSYLKDLKANVSLDPSWTIAENGQAVVPWGVRKALNWLKTVYNNPEIFITENGVSDSAELGDFDRIYYITEYLLAILDAMYEDNVNVFGYTVRSLIDEFEWTEGYSQHYGFYAINFEDPDLNRSFRLSRQFFSEVTGTLQIPEGKYTTSAPKPTTPDSADRIAFCSLLILVVTYICLSLA